MILGEQIDSEKFEELVDEDELALFDHEFKDGSYIYLFAAHHGKGIVARYPAFANDVGYEIHEVFPTLIEAIRVYKKYIEEMDMDRAQIWQIRVDFYVGGMEPYDAVAMVEELCDGIMDGQSVGVDRKHVQGIICEGISDDYEGED